MSKKENFKEGDCEEEYLKLSPEDLDLIAAKLTKKILADFRAFDCAACGRHFGYQNRGDSQILACSSNCLAVAMKKIRSMSLYEGGQGKGTETLRRGIPIDWGSPVMSPSMASPVSLRHSFMDAIKFEDFRSKVMQEIRSKQNEEEVAEEEWVSGGVVDSEKTQLGSSKFTIDSMPVSPNLRSGADVCISYWGSNRMLAVSAVADMNDLGMLSTTIEDHVNLQLAAPLDEIPCVGDIVLSPTEGVYYRAVVEQVLGKNRVLVRFIDYGDEATVDFFELRTLDEAISEHPIYSTMIFIEGIPEKMVNDVPDVIPELEPYLLQGVPCKVELFGVVKPGYWNGELWLPTGKSWSSVVMEAAEKKATGRGTEISATA